MVIMVEGNPRTWNEIRFYMRMQPCLHCGETEDIEILPQSMGKWGKRNAYHSYYAIRDCLRCGTQQMYGFLDRSHRYPHHLGSIDSPPQYHLGDNMPSEMISPELFLQELDRTSLEVCWEPETLLPEPWRHSGEKAGRALTCLNELLKFLPPGDTEIPDRFFPTEASREAKSRNSERFCRPWLEAEQGRYLRLQEQRLQDPPRIWQIDAEQSVVPPPQGELNRGTIDAHRRWVRNGKTGDGHLELAYVIGKKLRVGPQELSGVTFERCCFDGADFGSSSFDTARLVETSFRGANLGSCSFEGATLLRCDFEGARLALSKLTDCTLEGGNFDNVSLQRTLWYRSRVSHTRFQRVGFWNAALDDAVFTNCDFRAANFSLVTANILGTTSRACFVDCDLRDTNWEQNHLEDTVFVGCRFHGVRGRPRFVEGIRIERPDLSEAGDGSQIGTAEMVLAMLGW